MHIINELEDVALCLYFSHFFLFSFCLRCDLQFEWQFSILTLSSHAQVLVFELVTFYLFFLFFLVEGAFRKIVGEGDFSTIIVLTFLSITTPESFIHELLMFYCVSFLTFYHLLLLVEPLAFYSHLIFKFLF